MKESDEAKTLRLAIFKRLLTVLIVAVAWSALIVIRLVDLQILRSEEFQWQSSKQQQGFIDLHSKRGEILDRHLEQFAITVQAESIYTHPHQIEDLPGTATQVAGLLDLDPVSVKEKLASNAPFVFLKRQVSPRTGKALRDLQLPGIYSQDEVKRVYPSRELASHILGFVGVDGEGLGGLEYLYNKELMAEKVRIRLQVDGKRDVIERISPPREATGNTLILTLDRTIQHFAETVLRDTVISTQAKAGSAIVMDPATGEIYAMATYPSFNPNAYREYPSGNRRNRNIVGIYEPGSTFKVVTVSAVLNEGLGDPNEVIDCRVGTARIGNKVYHEAQHSYGDLTLTEVLAKSSNVGTVKLALRLGNDVLYDYAQRFGFGRKSGVDLPGEESGLLRPTSEWSKISIGAIAIGQEIGVTPLQMVRAISVIANGGFLVRPFVVQTVLSPQGDLLSKTEPERVAVLSTDTARTMRDMMGEVVLQGTGRNTKLKGYSSAGKSGTAQKIVNGLYSKEKYIASFIGFAPKKNPRLAALIVVDEPTGIYYGGYVAGPAFKEIMERALIHLRVPKDAEDDSDYYRELQVAKNDSSKLEPEGENGIYSVEDVFSGNDRDQALLSLVEENPPEGDYQHRVEVKLGTDVLPDFTGMNLRQVASECGQLGVRLKISGSGFAIAQRPPAGQRVSKQMICEVFFSTQVSETDATRRTAVERAAKLAAAR